MLFFAGIAVVLSILLAQGESLPLGKVVQTITPDMIGSFISQVTNLVGSGSDFSKRFGLNYNDIYNNQLLMSTVNALTNQRQREEEVHQGELMQKDLTNDNVHFSAEIALLVIICICLLLLTCSKLKDRNDIAKEKEKNKMIDRFKEAENMKQFRVFRDRFAEDIDL